MSTSRLEETEQFLSAHVEGLESKLGALDRVTQAMCARLSSARVRPGSGLSTLLRGHLEHWWKCYLLLKDELLFIHNGEVRNQCPILVRSYPRFGDLGLRQTRYFKGNKKDYVGVALDDLRELLTLAEGKVDKKMFKHFQAQYDRFFSRLDSVKDLLADLVRMVIRVLENLAGEQISRELADLEERLSCKKLGFDLRRPKGRIVIESIEVECPSSSEDEVKVAPSCQRKKRRQDIDDDSEGSGSDKEDEPSLDKIKIAHGVDPKELAEQFDRREAEELQTGNAPEESETSSSYYPGRTADFNRMGTEAGARGEWKVAVELHLQDLELCRDGDFVDRATAGRNCGVCYRHLGESDESQVYLEASFENTQLAVESSSVVDKIIAYREVERSSTELGNHFSAVQNPELALKWYTLSLRTLLDNLGADDSTETIDAAARSNFNLGTTHLTCGRFEEARPLFEASESFSIRIVDGDEQQICLRARNILYLAETQYELRRNDEARDLYEKALGLLGGLSDGDENLELVQALLEGIAEVDIDQAADREDASFVKAKASISRLERWLKSKDRGDDDVLRTLRRELRKVNCAPGFISESHDVSGTMSISDSAAGEPITKPSLIPIPAAFSVLSTVPPAGIVNGTNLKGPVARRPLRQQRAQAASLEVEQQRVAGGGGYYVRKMASQANEYPPPRVFVDLRAAAEARDSMSDFLRDAWTKPEGIGYEEAHAYSLSLIKAAKEKQQSC